MTQKVCLITGAGRGIGAAVARMMQARGHAVVLMSPSENCQALAAELGGVAHRGVAQSAEDLAAVVDLAMATHGRIDAVLNHTGHPPKGDLLDIADEKWDLAHEMIVKSVIRMARLVTPVMQAQGGGAIVNVTTYAAFEPSPMFPASCVYRAAVSSFTKLFADRYGPDNIRMNCLMPGFTDSLDVGRFADQIPLRRIARVEEQANVAAFLLTDASSYVTGQSLRVDGGLTRHV
ncbi:MAG: SDR family oxidoreductase [Rhodobacteraceae bacterium]|jgi:NAD(P)-dependent dehydrogenase (short-subunit alcohol dehydrogenase family)|nr:SDR family oxidoreductase [Paracoccaceae bacterium]